jgi:hypothetical protein
MRNNVNLWNQPDVPHKNWQFVNVIDTGTAEETCEMCGNERIRYVHSMTHSNWSGPLRVGCVCAEKMTDDYVNPRKRERVLRNAAAKRLRDKKRERAEKEEHRQAILAARWKDSVRGNPYLQVYLEYKHGTRKIFAVVFKSKFNDMWAMRVDNVQSGYKYNTVEAAKIAAREEMLHRFARQT